MRYKALNTEKLLELWELINARVVRFGLERFDVSDYKSHPIFNTINKPKIYKYFVYFLRIFEIYFPFTTRKLLKINKVKFPTTYYHLGMAYLIMSKLNITMDKEYFSNESKEMCLEALSLSLSYKESIFWESPYYHNHSNWSLRPANNDMPKSVAHSGTRLGTLLIKVGNELDNQDLITKGIDSAKGLIKYHNWHYYNDESCTMSYFADSDDEVINISADTALMLCEIPVELRSDEMNRVINGLIKMLINEQNIDGSWYYCTRWHYSTFNDKPYIDNHHTAMNLSALAVALDKGNLINDIYELALNTLIRGLDYYIKTFYLDDGTALYLSNSSRKADVVGYCEGILAFYEVIKRKIDIPNSLLVDITELIPKVLNKAICEFVNPITGEVASSKRLGKLYNIQSIRWGAGPIMQAVVAYLDLKEGKLI